MTPQDTARLLAKKQNHLMDLKRLFYEGSSLITSVGEVVEFFHLSGKKIFFLLTIPPNTLNSLKNLRSLACRAHLRLSLILGKSRALYVRKNHLDAPHGVFVVGSQEFRALLIESGVKISGDPLYARRWRAWAQALQTA